MTTILFACVHNAGRSQMAAAFFNVMADPALGRGLSAGTEPGKEVHPIVVDAMREVGIDLAGVTPQLLTLKIARDSNYLVTMGCGAVCPIIPEVRREDWPLEDPKGKPLAEVRRIRDEIRNRVAQLIQKFDCARKEATA